MEPITFYKMSGSGNDFIVIDNRQKIIGKEDLIRFIALVCRRKMAVGADGLILIEDSDKADFKWHFFNSDGGRAEMCGNGARCAARLSYLKGIAGPNLTFETDAGLISAQVTERCVKIKMPDPTGLKLAYEIELTDGPFTLNSINIGVPHVVILVAEIEDLDVVKTGREIRFHRRFQPAGTNVNFIHTNAAGHVSIRTYERGVEGETLACGTGSIAAALVMASEHGLPSPIKVKTKSGDFLTIYFKRKPDGFTDVHLKGDARLIYKGELHTEALE